MKSSNSHIDWLKRKAREARPDLKHGHVMEGLAAGFGFATWAALKASDSFDHLQRDQFDFAAFDRRVDQLANRGACS